MRRSLIVTVAAAVGMVLLAMLVPMTVLLRDYALEDRLATAALEVQATETVVSGAGDDKGEVNLYVARINQDNPILTTVLYPGAEDIGPHPGEDARVEEARRTGQARVDDIDGGAEILVPVSLGGSSAAPEQTPVIRIVVARAGVRVRADVAGRPGDGRAGARPAGGGVADGRSARPFLRRPDPSARGLDPAARRHEPPRAVTASGPPEVRELNLTVNRLVERVDLLLERERQAVSDLSHRLRTPVTALRLRIDSLSDTGDRPGWARSSTSSS